jgi:hypothetical protein
MVDFHMPFLRVCVCLCDATATENVSGEALGPGSLSEKKSKSIGDYLLIAIFKWKLICQKDLRISMVEVGDKNMIFRVCSILSYLCQSTIFDFF